MIRGESTTLISINLDFHRGDLQGITPSDDEKR